MPNTPLIVNIVYWTSNEINLRRKTFTGELSVSDKHIFINTENGILEIPLSELIECDLKKGYKVGTYVHLLTKNRIFNFVIPRINIANWFIIGNKNKTEKIYKTIKKNNFVCS